MNTDDMIHKAFFTLLAPIPVGQPIEISSVWYEGDKQHFFAKDELIGELFYTTERKEIE